MNNDGPLLWKLNVSLYFLSQKVRTPEAPSGLLLCVFVLYADTILKHRLQKSYCSLCSRQWLGSLSRSPLKSKGAARGPRYALHNKIIGRI